MAAQGYDLVIAVGPAEEHAVGVVAREYPDVRFAIVDDSYASRGIGALANVEGLVFADQQSGYLAGYLAGLVEQDAVLRPAGTNTVSTISSSLVPRGHALRRRLPRGSARVRPGRPAARGLLERVTAPARCSSSPAADPRRAPPSSSPSRAPAASARSTRRTLAHVWAIGCELDQSAITDAMLVSAVDRADRAVYLTLEALADGTLQTGRDVEFGLAQGAVGLAGMNAAVPPSILRQLARRHAPGAGGPDHDPDRARTPDTRRLAGEGARDLAAAGEDRAAERAALEAPLRASIVFAEHGVALAAGDPG